MCVVELWYYASISSVYINIMFYQWTNASIYAGMYHGKKFRILMRTFLADWMFITYSVIFHKASGVIVANS